MSSQCGGRPIVVQGVCGYYIWGVIWYMLSVNLLFISWPLSARLISHYQHLMSPEIYFRTYNIITIWYYYIKGHILHLHKN